MKKLTIRRLQPNDAEVISAAFQNQGWQKPAELYHQYAEEQSGGRRVVLVAERGSEFSGHVTIVWQPDYPYFKENGIPEIQDVHVLTAFRRQGIGSMLMDKAEDIIRARSGMAGLGVGLFGDNGDAQSLYINRGYVPDGNGLFQNGRYLRHGEQIAVDGDVHLFFVKPLR